MSSHCSRLRFKSVAPIWGQNIDNWCFSTFFADLQASCGLSLLHPSQLHWLLPFAGKSESGLCHLSYFRDRDVSLWWINHQILIAASPTAFHWRRSNTLRQSWSIILFSSAGFAANVNNELHRSLCSRTSNWETKNASFKIACAILGRVRLMLSFSSDCGSCDECTSWRQLVYSAKRGMLPTQRKTWPLSLIICRNGTSSRVVR